MLMLWSLAVTPGVTHIGAYHRPWESNFWSGWNTVFWSAFIQSSFWIQIWMFLQRKGVFQGKSHVNLLSSWRRFLTYDICLCDISEHLWFYTPCSIHSTENLDAQYVQLQHVGIYQSSSWRFFGKPGNARVLLLLLSPAPSSRRSGRPALGERKSSRGLIGCSAFIDSIQI